MIDYRPDWPPTNPSVASECSFLIVDKSGQLRTSYAATAVSNWSTALNATCVGARMVRKAAGTPFVFFGSSSRIEEWNSTTLTNVSSAAYATGTNRWWFCQYGDSTIACNYANNTQVRTGATGTAFADLTNAPKAKIFLSQSGHLLALNYDDGSAVPDGIKWASQGTTTTWTAANSNTAGNAQLTQSPGPITAGAELHDIVVVWKSDSMYIGRRIGGAGTDIWRFNLLSPKIGCVGQEAWAATPVGIIFASRNSGVYKFDGSVPQPIDAGIRQELYRNINSSTQISHDEASSCVFIWTDGGNHYCYNYAQDRWTKAYNSTSLGNASFTQPVSGVRVCIVRDANYTDFLSLGGSSDTNKRAHLIVSNEKKVCNLSNGTTVAASLNAQIVLPTVRHPKAGPREDTYMNRITPVFGYDSERLAFSEPTTGTCTVTRRSRLSGGDLAPAVSGTLSSGKSLDIQAAANSFTVQYDWTNEAFVLSDMLYDMDLAGESP